MDYNGLTGFLLVFGTSVVLARHVEQMQMSDRRFSWNLCNKTDVPLVLTNLVLTPAPLHFDKPLTLTADVLVTSDVGTTDTFGADFEVIMNVGGQFFDICNYEPRLCHIDDACSLLARKAPALCPILFHQKWNCRCPIRKHEYSVKQLTITVPKPGFTVTGEFDVTVRMHERGKEISCVHARFCIETC